jgi:hypothetical protein
MAGGYIYWIRMVDEDVHMMAVTQRDMPASIRRIWFFNTPHDVLLVT